MLLFIFKGHISELFYYYSFRLDVASENAAWVVYCDELFPINFTNTKANFGNFSVQ